MNYNRIIMFCDYGLDDAIATLHILKNSSMFDKIDIVPIGGNVDVNTSYRNAHTLFAALNVDVNKVRIIDTRDIKQCAENIPDVHGSDGIGDVLEKKVSAVKVVDFYAFKKEIADSAQPTLDCVLSLGPCTIPAILGYIPFCTVLMGGTNKEAPNYGDYEFNEGMDVEAFRSFAKAATAVATLDTCHDKKFMFESFKMNDPLGDKLIDKYIAMCKDRSAPIAVYDYCAALAVTNPEMFEAERVLRPDGVEFNELRLI